MGVAKMVSEKTREEFIVWIRLAMNDRESGAYEELYQFLTSCFVRADTDKDGKVTMNHFDNLIEEAAVLPRRKTCSLTSLQGNQLGSSSSRPWTSRVLATSPLTSGSGLPLSTSLANSTTFLRMS